MLIMLSILNVVDLGSLAAVCVNHCHLCGVYR